MEEKKIVRCGIYTRKSHDVMESAFNSLDAQRESAENYIASQKLNGWVALPDHYDDGGFTGGNMERPALKQLLADVENGKIDCVLVYKIDRLSRSLIDFTKLIELFNKHNVSFISVTQHFSTIDSAGRMMLNILITFSQFEHEIIRERIRDKVAASKRRGKYCGGSPVIGYDADIEKKKLVVNGPEAEIVRYAFRRFVELGSGKELACDLNEKGYRTKTWTSKKELTHGGQLWNQSHVYRMLRNPLYAGLVKHNDKTFPGEHEAIIAPEEWHQIQASLKDNQRRKDGDSGARINSPLQGVLKCGHCGGAMGATYTGKKGGKRYAYYICMTDYKRAQSICPVRSVSAGDIEKTVLEQLGAVFRTPALVADVYFTAKKLEQAECERLAADKARLLRELEEAKVSGDTLRMRDVARELINVSNQLKSWSEVPVTEQDISGAFKDMDSLWEALFPVERQRLIKMLIEKIEIREDGLDIVLKTDGMTSLVTELSALDSEAV